MAYQSITKTVGGVALEDPYAWPHQNMSEAYVATRARLAGRGSASGDLMAARKRGGTWFSVGTRVGGQELAARTADWLSFVMRELRMKLRG